MSDPCEDEQEKMNGQEFIRTQIWQALKDRIDAESSDGRDILLNFALRMTRILTDAVMPSEEELSELSMMLKDPRERREAKASSSRDPFDCVWDMRMAATECLSEYLEIGLREGCGDPFLCHELVIGTFVEMIGEDMAPELFPKQSSDQSHLEALFQSCVVGSSPRMWTGFSELVKIASYIEPRVLIAMNRAMHLQSCGEFLFFLFDCLDNGMALQAFDSVRREMFPMRSVGIEKIATEQRLARYPYQVVGLVKTLKDPLLSSMIEEKFETICTIENKDTSISAVMDYFLFRAENKMELGVREVEKVFYRMLAFCCVCLDVENFILIQSRCKVLAKLAEVFGADPFYPSLADFDFEAASGLPRSKWTISVSPESVLMLFFGGSDETRSSTAVLKEVLGSRGLLPAIARFAWEQKETNKTLFSELLNVYDPSSGGCRFELPENSMSVVIDGMSSHADSLAMFFASFGSERFRSVFAPTTFVRQPVDLLKICNFDTRNADIRQLVARFYVDHCLVDGSAVPPLPNLEFLETHPLVVEKTIVGNEFAVASRVVLYSKEWTDLMALTYKIDNEELRKALVTHSRPQDQFHHLHGHQQQQQQQLPRQPRHAIEAPPPLMTGYRSMTILPETMSSSDEPFSISLPGSPANDANFVNPFGTPLSTPRSHGFVGFFADESPQKRRREEEETKEDEEQPKRKKNKKNSNKVKEAVVDVAEVLDM